MMTLTPSQQAHVTLRTQRKVLELFLHAAKRACGGRMPSRAERDSLSSVEETPEGVLMRWQGEPVLSITSSPQGLAWEFLGKAAVA